MRMLAHDRVQLVPVRSVLAAGAAEELAAVISGHVDVVEDGVDGVSDVQHEALKLGGGPLLAGLGLPLRAQQMAIECLAKTSGTRSFIVLPRDLGTSSLKLRGRGACGHNMSRWSEDKVWEFLPCWKGWARIRPSTYAAAPMVSRIRNCGRSLMGIAATVPERVVVIRGGAGPRRRRHQGTPRYDEQFK